MPPYNVKQCAGCEHWAKEVSNPRFGICSCRDAYEYVNKTPAVHICIQMQLETPRNRNVKTAVIRRTEYMENRPMGQTAVSQNGAVVHTFCDEEYELMKQADRLELLYRIAMGAAWEVNFDKECCEKFVFDALEKDLKAAVQKVKKELFL